MDEVNRKIIEAAIKLVEYTKNPECGDFAYDSEFCELLDELSESTIPLRRE
jgi:hypothetical protein